MSNPDQPETPVTETRALAGVDAARVAYDDIASLNLDGYEGLGMEEIGLLLKELADRASVAQLESILDGPFGVGMGTEEDKPFLVARYVEWRLDTIKRLRKLKETLVIEGLD